MKLLPTKITANTNDFATDNDLLLQRMQNRIDFLQNWLDDILVRDVEKRDKDIKNIIDQLKKVAPSMLTYYVLDNYDHRFFSSEVDTEFKIELAQNILNLVTLIYPNYKNELLTHIANNSSKYTANYIYVEKV